MEEKTEKNQKKFSLMSDDMLLKYVKKYNKSRRNNVIAILVSGVGYKKYLSMQQELYLMCLEEAIARNLLTSRNLEE